MHTQFGISYHNKLTKAFENLYIRLAKMVASPSSSLLLKKRALNMWCISFHDASLLRNSAILHTLGELLQHEANIQQMSHRDMATDDAISCSAHGVPPSLTLPPRLRPVEKLVHMATAGYNVHQACWHVFSWLCKQFMANDDHRAVLNELRPSASSKALACASPRKRLSLPPKLIVSTLEESIDHMYLVLLQEMTKTKDALVAWNSHASQMAPCLQASQVMLLADPHVVSSVSTMFMATYKQRAPELGWTVCMWVHIEEYSNVPLVLVANGDVPLVQMTITVEEHGHVGFTWSSTDRLLSNRTLKRGGWTHVACTLFKNKIELYIDGGVDATRSGQYDIVLHPTFTVGGLVDPLKPEHHSSHILLDDMTVHEEPLAANEISSLAAAGPLLFRIKQRQILDQYCTSLLSLLTWLAVVKAPAMTDEIHLMLTLLPLCPPPAHPHMFQLLSCVLPSIAPTLEIPSLSETLLAFLVKQFGIAWFSAQNNLYGPPELYQLLTSRKDNCISSLVRAGHLSKDGVASWIVSDCPIKAKSTSILRSMRASLLDSFVTLFRSLLTSSTWVPELLQLFSIESPEKVLLSCRADSSLLSNREPVVQVILSIYVLGGYMKTTPPPIKMGESMMQLLEWVLQHPASVDGHVGSLDDMDQDVQIATYMHVRVSLLRLLTAQTPTPTVAGALLQLPIVVTELLSTAIRPFKASLEGVFGNEFDVVSKLDNVRGLMDWITDDSNESMSKKRVILDTLATSLFERLPYVRGVEVSPWWVLSAAQNLHVLGGDVDIDEYRIKGIQHFPTVKLNGVSVTAGSGMWYYEVVLLSDGLMQIGWIDSAFESDALQGQGVGDHTNSWAYDGTRFRRKKWNVGAMDYGEKWHSGDIVGVLLDTDRCEMQYFLNGRPLGVAFEGLRLNHPIYPAMSLNVDQSAQFHFTSSQFLYLPSMEKIQPVSSAILGHVCEHNTTAATKATTPNAGQEQDARRTDLVEGLIGLGFPPEWALRCARETSMELSESGAIAWIMEQMEHESQSVRPAPLHGIDTSTHHLQQLDGFMDVKKSSVMLEAPPLIVQVDQVESTTNPFLTTDEFCEDVYHAEPFAPRAQPPPTSPEVKATDKSTTFVVDLAETCPDEEILPLYLVAESARSMWCARDSVNHLISYAQYLPSPGFPEAFLLEFVQSVVGRHDDTPMRLDTFMRIFHVMCTKNPAFLSTLIADMVRHFQAACAKEHWYTSFRPGGRVPKSSVNLEWSSWLARVLFTLARQNDEAKLRIVGSSVWPTLMKAATSCNATLRHRAVLVMTAYLQMDVGATSAGLPSIRVDYLVDWLAAKVRKEKPTRAVYTDYTQSVFQLAVTLDAMLDGVTDTPPATESRSSPPLSDLFIEHIGTTSVTIARSSALENVSHFQLATQTVVNGRVALSPFADVAEAQFQPSPASFTFMNLQPDTTYSLRAVLPPDEYTVAVDFDTACESLLELDPSSMGANLELLNYNMSVRNRVNKKWHAVRASVSYTSGVHTWDVRIDKCVSKNIFVGICTADASMENYVGSDAWGWGFLANKAVWHNKSKLQTYGDIFKQGDVVTVTLNLDRGTLSFARNGDSFGVGVEHLPSHEAAYYPAISMYNKDDQVTFLPHEAAMASKAAKSGVASVMRMVRDVQRLHALWDDSSQPPLHDNDVYSAWVQWTLGQLVYVTGAQGEILAVDVSDKACAPFGLSPGDVVFTTKGMCTILGVAHHQMWYYLESHSPPTGPAGQVLAGWNVQVCRDMLSRPNEFPITRQHHEHQHSAWSLCEVTFDEFAARQGGWTPALDEAFVGHLQLLAYGMSVESILHLAPKDILNAFANEPGNPEKVPGKSTLDCLCRVGIIHASNRMMQHVLPVLVSSSGLHLVPRARHSCVVGTKFVRDLIKKSATLTMPSATDDLDEDPMDLAKFKLTLPVTPCVPYWESRSASAGVSNTSTAASAESRLASIAGQLAAFFGHVDERDLRRQFMAPPASVYTTSVQPRAFRVVCDDLPDPNSAYLHVFRECAREVQSRTVALFVPVASSHDALPSTMVNLDENDMAQFECVGKVIGMAWRCDVPMPWLFVPLVWKFLAGEPLTLADWHGIASPSPPSAIPNDVSAVVTGLAMATWTPDEFEVHKIPMFGARDEADYVRPDTRGAYVDALLASLLAPYQPALNALRRGITTIVPASCLGLLSAAQLQRLLTSPAVDLVYLEAQATYSGDAATCPDVAASLWKIVHGFGLDDQRHFCRFLLGHDGWHASRVSLDIRPCPSIPQQHGCSEDQATSSYGYPYVERTTESEASNVSADPMTFVRLYVPAYSSVELLQKKLHLAMTHTDQPLHQSSV
ncbi:hypothetical protein H310_03478 [Aphanomyces invadans]|uniref:B30.2/SPRY domain-containing protein n=1 Tax=Aphanomyces invadans TaxID=157072 RepID=A0A024UHM2_9STRA|nr:hypothetical protein H310_03478 [Aphanomyces invadans]ETW05794.1 hypothetical protein H310_03478 [Aphanomyces invadans]|eukprot:XP_008865571.1 hypothetical protein H310_03478 [Aphanomyces invadans]